MTTTNCTINCTINSSQALELDSGHTLLTEPRSNEFEFELDIDNNDSVLFQMPDFSSGGSSYTVAVTATANGTTQVWSHNGQASVSPSETDEIEISIDVTATPTSGSPLTGGGVIRIQPKGKPD